MGTIKAHEFMSLDGVVDAPTWTFDYGSTLLWPGHRQSHVQLRNHPVGRNTQLAAVGSPPVPYRALSC